MRERGTVFEGWLTCPVCGEPLLAGQAAPDTGAGDASADTGMPAARDATSVRCGRGHSFDLAREGYLNLLRSKRTGDSKEMLLARRAFLERGHYAPLAEALADSVVAFFGEGVAEGARSPSGEPPRSEAFRAAGGLLGGAAGPLAEPTPAPRGALPPVPGATGSGTPGAGDRPLRVLDAGCGEGYYLDRLGQRLSEAPAPAPSALLIGLDSAREAIRMVAKRLPDAALLVADLKERLPIAYASLDAILNVFAPRDLAAFARVLVPGGLLLIAIPAPDHLVELRLAHGLLGIEEQKLERLLEGLAPHFASVRTRDLRHTLHLTPDAVESLIAMTPSQRHPQRRIVPDAQGTSTSEVTAAFILLACRRS